MILIVQFYRQQQTSNILLLCRKYKHTHTHPLIHSAVDMIHDILDHRAYVLFSCSYHIKGDELTKEMLSTVELPQQLVCVCVYDKLYGMKYIQIQFQQYMYVNANRINRIQTEILMNLLLIELNFDLHKCACVWMIWIQSKWQNVFYGIAIRMKWMVGKNPPNAILYNEYLFWNGSRVKIDWIHNKWISMYVD